MKTTAFNCLRPMPGNLLRTNILPMSVYAIQRPTVTANPPGGEAATQRIYFRSLRAAEMAAWELSGGDYVRSGYLTAA